MFSLEEGTILYFYFKISLITYCSVDVIFSNWLFMYLDDEDVRALLKKILSWLREDGYLFFRESCFHQSGEEQGTHTTEQPLSKGQHI